MPKFVIALGGNLGNVPETFEQFYLELAGAFHAVIPGKSSVLRNPPQGCPPGTPDFFNAVCLAEKTPCDPFELLDFLQDCEVRHGRPRVHGVNQSRTLDLDIVWFEGVVLNTPRLILPHPRAKERDFVLIPLREVAPELEKLL